MEELKVFDLYEKSSNKKKESFSKTLDSKLKVTTDYDKVECDIEWLEMMEGTIRYIDNILRNPNRFIINEEDIVKIELARRVTVDSIKHLSKNTNLIQKIEDNGDVKPSKILNINKEESFNTYENRFIYSLIRNMQMYIDRKKNNLITSSSLKSNKKLEYVGTSNVNGEKVNVNFNLETNLNKTNNHKDKENHDLLERIERLELNISDLTNSEVYQRLHKLHINLVTSPIKKTNVILKNTNFQYALKLWNYMQNHMEDGTKREKKNESYEDNGELKDYMDETFLLNYLVSNTLNKEESDNTEQTKEITNQLVDNMILKLVQINPEMTKSEVENLIGEKFAVIKYRNTVTDSEIIKIYKEAINEYFDTVSNLKL